MPSAAPPLFRRSENDGAAGQIPPRVPAARRGRRVRPPRPCHADVLDVVQQNYPRRTPGSLFNSSLRPFEAMGSMSSRRRAPLESLTHAAVVSNKVACDVQVPILCGAARDSNSGHPLLFPPPAAHTFPHLRLGPRRLRTGSRRLGTTTRLSTLPSPAVAHRHNRSAPKSPRPARPPVFSTVCACSAAISSSGPRSDFADFTLLPQLQFLKGPNKTSVPCASRVTDARRRPETTRLFGRRYGTTSLGGLS